MLIIENILALFPEGLTNLVNPRGKAIEQVDFCHAQ
jgi:hypothetical protein